MNPTLYQRSIELILEHQSPGGAYIASPNFPTYAYCWLRDGSFIAHSMDLTGNHHSSKAFFYWVHRTIQRYAYKVDRVLEKIGERESIKDGEYLHTRYQLDGTEVSDNVEWGNFQYDGYGTWLWALAEHLRLTGDKSLLIDTASSVQITARYLSFVWMLPSYDCWEEHSTYIHPYSIGAAYAGLQGAISLAKLGVPGIDILELSETCEKIKDYVVSYCENESRIVKSIPSEPMESTDETRWETEVDASLVGLSTPYRLFSSYDEVFKHTLDQIEKDLLRPGGGVYRYLQDTYYGGGEWILLAAWLGWHYTETGELEKAAELARWIEDQANQNGWLPEQISTYLLDPACFLHWQGKWGKVANPLLWSHAMYLILIKTLERKCKNGEK